MTNKKLSVIIPTVYKKPAVLYKSIELLDRDDIVDEIIIISNAECRMQFPKTNKLSAWEPKTNAYVNKSWNMGIHLMRNNNFLLLNDDILFCEGYCSMVVESDVFNDEQTGLIGLDNEAINLFDKNSVDEIQIPEKEKDTKLIFTPLEKYELTGDWGSAIFGRKENYHAIPECFQIIFGDNYLLYHNLLNGKRNYSVSGVKFNHIHSSSASSPEFSEVYHKDMFAWAHYRLNYIKKTNKSV